MSNMSGGTSISRVVKSQLFTANGTWTPPAANTLAWYKVIGGGGGGAGGWTADSGGDNTGADGGDGASSVFDATTALGGAKGKYGAAQGAQGTQKGAAWPAAGIGLQNLTTFETWSEGKRGAPPVDGWGGGGDAGPSWRTDRAMTTHLMPNGGNSGECKWGTGTYSAPVSVTVGAGGSGGVGATLGQVGQQGSVEVWWIE